MTRDNVPTPAQPPAPIPGEKPALLTQRTTLILFIALCVGVGVGVLSFFANKPYPEAVITGMLIAGACAVGLHSVMA
nr:hypothetical protein OG491_35620 [Streptomyces sp. NBC_01175]